MVKAHNLALGSGIACGAALIGADLADAINLWQPLSAELHTLAAVTAGTLIVLGTIGHVAHRYGIPVNEALLHGYQLAREHDSGDDEDEDDDRPDATVVQLPTPRPDRDGGRHRHPSRRRAQL